jgi:hypothetical protein
VIILSHRGWWKTDAEKNSREAFQRSFEHGWGAELDVRDFQGGLVVSHDPPKEGKFPFGDLLGLYRQAGCQGTLAINIKADGLQSLLKAVLQQYEIDNYFVFDMSIPDALGYLKADIRAFTRQSEYETQPAFLEQAAGVWLDAFHGPWADDSVIERHMAVGRPVALVSPELHRRPHLDEWAAWRELEQRAGTNNLLMLCTDFPDEAERFFHG